ncbi:MAG: hypothetical protein V1845_02155 [bacterium]
MYLYKQLYNNQYFISVERLVIKKENRGEVKLVGPLDLDHQSLSLITVLITLDGISESEDNLKVLGDIISEAINLAKKGPK